MGTAVRNGVPVVETTSIDDFVKAIGGAKVSLNERIWDSEVRVDGDLATVWTKYDFLRAGAFSHCGVDAFQLARTPEGWKIIQIADTHRQEGCWHKPGS